MLQRLTGRLRSSGKDMSTMVETFLLPSMNFLQFANYAQISWRLIWWTAISLLRIMVAPWLLCWRCKLYESRISELECTGRRRHRTILSFLETGTVLEWKSSKCGIEVVERRKLGGDVNLAPSWVFPKSFFLVCIDLKFSSLTSLLESTKIDSFSPKRRLFTELLNSVLKNFISGTSSLQPEIFKGHLSFF